MKPITINWSNSIVNLVNNVTYGSIDPLNNLPAEFYKIYPSSQIPKGQVQKLTIIFSPVDLNTEVPITIYGKGAFGEFISESLTLSSIHLVSKNYYSYFDFISIPKKYQGNDVLDTFLITTSINETCYTVPFIGNLYNINPLSSISISNANALNNTLLNLLYTIDPIITWKNNKKLYPALISSINWMPIQVVSNNSNNMMLSDVVFSQNSTVSFSMPFTAITLLSNNMDQDTSFTATFLQQGAR